MRKAYLLTLLVALCWASSLVANKAMLLAVRGGRHLTPAQVCFWAIAVGWTALFALLAVRGRLAHLREIAARGWLVLVLMGLFGWAGYTVALNYAYTLLPLPSVIVINYLHPVFTVLFQGPLFSRALHTISQWEVEPDRSQRPGALRLALGFLLCLAGVALIATQGRLTSLLALHISGGALSALFAAFAWGVYSNLGRFVALRPGSPDRSLPELHSLLAMTFGLVTLAAVLARGHQFVAPHGFRASLYLLAWGPATFPVWLLITYTGLIVYCGAFTTWLVVLERGAHHGHAHHLPPLTYLTPVLAVVLGRVLLHEGFGAGFWAGAVLIALGNTVIVWPGPSRRRR